MASAASPEPLQPGCRLVYLVLAHNQPELLARLVGRLHTPDVGFVIHVDAHVDSAPFRKALAVFDRVHFVSQPVKVRWAAFSQVESTLRAMRTALALWGLEPSHHVVLSGVDYPLKPGEQIVEFLQRHADVQFIRRFDVVRSGDARQIRRLRGRHFRQLADRNTPARKPLFVLEYLLRAFPRSLPQGIRFTSGSNWIALTAACAQWCVDYADAHPSLVRLFHGMFGPDEIFFHTLVENSPFAASAGAVEPYYQVTELGGPWRYGNLHHLHPIEPITRMETLAGPLANPAILFARKFDSGRSRDVLEALDAEMT